MVVLSITCSLAMAAKRQIIILDKPVRVIANDINGSDIDEFDHYPLQVTIAYGADRYKFQTDLFLQNSNINNALEYQKTHTHWKGPYLLVGWERGGGNRSRGYLAAVFKLIKGRLEYLGEVDGEALEDGGFLDWYDKYEGNDLTSHAGSPVIRLVLEEKGGRLVVNLEKTWKENQQRLNQNIGLIDIILKDKKMDSESKANQLSDPLLFNSVLAKYCKHKADLDGFIDFARKKLDENKMTIFLQILRGVIPGELPRPAIKVMKY